MITRRWFGLAGSAALTMGAAPATGEPASVEAAARLARIEAGTGGRLGVAMLDTGSDARLAHRAEERFPLCSTFKLLAAAAILARVDGGQESLERALAYGPSELVENSPVTKARVADGAMPLADLCEAAMTRSDNTAGNLLLSAIGGPAGLTAYTRSLGDGQSRLDRTETALNEALPGDPRDTTTPAAMLANLRTLVFGTALSAPSRARLEGWLLANRTGAARLRAGLPRDWRVGDKTGTGERGTTNDVGVLYPPGGAPILAAVYLTGSTGTAGQRDAVLAEVGRLIVDTVAGTFGAR